MRTIHFAGRPGERRATPMDPADRERMLRHLAAAEAAIAHTRGRIARQRGIIANSEGASQQLAEECALLVSLETKLARQERHLAMLLKHLVRCGWTVGEPPTLHYGL